MGTPHAIWASSVHRWDDQPSVWQPDVLIDSPNLDKYSPWRRFDDLGAVHGIQRRPDTGHSKDRIPECARPGGWHHRWNEQAAVHHGFVHRPQRMGLGA